ncbi:hypothetical protein KSP39_PZI014698 [Platanthera zijinensis]|uniref:Rhodanese domain-containing protein n=1 Tax=Platanthera zijinensis TaxID=2320716 RepID=A0AAP0BAM5_9ASPA
MAISFSPTSPLPRFSLAPSSPLRISYFSVRISCVASISNGLVLASSSHSVHKGEGGEGNGGVEFSVVTFYKFVSIEDPDGEVAKHHAFLKGLDIHGRIYVNEQGINAQYSGPNADVLAYADWLKDDPRFSDIFVQTSPALYGHAFPRLKMRYKPSLFEGGTAHLPMLDSTMRATPLTPAEWRNRLQISSNIEELSNKKTGSNHDRKLLLLDVRNGYEWDAGHFQGAERPDVDSFRYTDVGLSIHETDLLAGVDKENTDILMYCTGGIRCDVYSTILRQRGFQKLFTLNGGISHYLMTEGSAEWIGNLFVFDSRLSLSPSTYNSTLTTSVRSQIVSKDERFAKCYICASQLLEFRHRNCANLDCNKLFLSCGNCVEEFRGCCCSDCTQAHRLRPVLPGYKRYQKWHRYRDGNF